MIKPIVQVLRGLLALTVKPPGGRHASEYSSARRTAGARPVGQPLHSPWANPWRSPSKAEAQALFTGDERDMTIPLGRLRFENDQLRVTRRIVMDRQCESTLRKARMEEDRRRVLLWAKRGQVYPYRYPGASSRRCSKASAECDEAARDASSNGWRPGFTETEHRSHGVRKMAKALHVSPENIPCAAIGSLRYWTSGVHLADGLPSETYRP